MNLLASDRQLSRLAPTAALAVVWLLVQGALALANTPPSIGALGDQYLAEGQTLELAVEALDADGDPLSLSLGVRPQGAVVTDHGDGSASVSWSAEYLGPNSAAGSPFTLEVIASDGLSASSQSLQIFVQNVNRAPSIVAPDTIFVEVGDTVAFQASGADPDLDPVFWNSSALPDGARLESVSGGSVADFRWAPNAADSGIATVTFIARDIYGLADTAQSTMVVSVGDPYTVSIARDTVFPGEVVSLPVYLKNRAPVSGFSFVMHYDPSVMAILSVTTAGARAEGFESLLYLKDVPAPGDLRVSGQRGVGENIPAGEGALFTVNVLISTQSGLPGLFLPVIFKFNQFGEETDNTLNDSAGALVITEEIVFASGGVNVAGLSEIILGDINLNGVPFEVADALRFTNYFIDQTKYGFTPQQFANSDVNRDGIAASIADLVTLLSEVTAGGAGAGRIVSGVSPQSVTVAGVAGALTLSNARGIAAGLFEFRCGADMIEFEESLRLSDAAVVAGMELHSHSRDGVTRVLLISGSGGAFEIDNVTALHWTSTLAVELAGVELASAAGRTVEGVLANAGAALPDGFTLEQNYPNPFNPSTTIRFALEAPAAVRLDVFDALGRKVTTLAQGRYGAGSHTVTWDGENSSGETVASGVYFYRLQAGGQSLARKMALLK